MNKWDEVIAATEPGGRYAGMSDEGKKLLRKFAKRRRDAKWNSPQHLLEALGGFWPEMDDITLTRAQLIDKYKSHPLFTGIHA